MITKFTQLFILLFFTTIYSSSFAQLQNIFGFTTERANSVPAEIVVVGDSLYVIDVYAGPDRKGELYRTDKNGNGYHSIKLFDNEAFNPTGLVGNDTILYGTTIFSETGRGKMFQYSLTTGEFKFTKQFSGYDGQALQFKYITDSLIWGYVGTSWEDNGSIFTIKPDGTEFTKVYNNTNLTTGQTPVDMLIVGDEIFVSFANGGGIPWMEGSITRYSGSVGKMKLDGSNFQTIVQGEEGKGTRPRSLINYQGKIYGHFSRNGFQGIASLYRVNYDGSDFRTLARINRNQGTGNAILVGDVIYAMTIWSLYSYDISKGEFNFLQTFRNGLGPELTNALVHDNNTLFITSRISGPPYLDGVSRFDLPIPVTPTRGLTLNSFCSDNPDAMKTWEVINPNDFPVSVQWDLIETEESGTYEAAPGSTFFNTPTIAGENKVKILWMDEEDRPRRQEKISVAGPCFVKGLVLNSVCSSDPATSKRWEVINPNPFVVNITWDLVGEDSSGTFTALPGETYFYTPTLGQVESVKIVWIDEEGSERRQEKLATGATCGVDEFVAVNTAITSEASTDVSTPEENRTQFFSIYPNPFTDRISINLNLADNGEHLISIYDNFGRLVDERKVSPSYRIVNEEITTDNLSNGIYLVTVTSKQSGLRVTKRIVKQ